MKKSDTKTSKKISKNNIEPISLKNTQLFFEEIPVTYKHPIANEKIEDFITNNKPQVNRLSRRSLKS